VTGAEAHHRSIRIPRLMRVVRGPAATMAALATLVEPGQRLLVVHSGARSATGYGETVAGASLAHGFKVDECEVGDNTESTVRRVAGVIQRTHPDFVVAVGGGRVVDVGKLAALRTRAQIVTIPTQLASDAICSPIAVILDDTGRKQSVGAQMPAAIVVDMEVVEQAPLATWRSGVGDLISNLSAVRDWRQAHEVHGEPLDDFACLTSEAAALSVYDDHADLGDDGYRQKVIRGLILSGIAMEMAGSSRPSSGSEHLISHALDRILPVPRPHGLQVAAGTIAASLIRGEDPARLVAFFRRTGLPLLPGDLDITLDDFLAAVRQGPATRPGRQTCLDAVGEPEIGRLREAYERGLA
jgi:glycerol-1-phosphate dehydrogenase [NAD(P)+]